MIRGLSARATCVAKRGLSRGDGGVCRDGLIRPELEFARSRSTVRNSFWLPMVSQPAARHPVLAETPDRREISDPAT